MFSTLVETAQDPSAKKRHMAIMVLGTIACETPDKVGRVGGAGPVLVPGVPGPGCDASCTR